MDVSIEIVDRVIVIEACVSGARLIDRSDGVAHDGVGTMYFLAFDSATVEIRGRRLELSAGSFAVTPDVAEIHGTRGLAVIDRAHRGLFHVGGPVEATGRLKYIDGCSDTLLVAPVVHGDPCLNLLHIPQGVVQTDHHHPSVRVGLVLDGFGRCVTTSEGVRPLVPGSMFVLPPGEVHRFETPSTEMLLLAWHPDSDCGPTDEDHPMFNRTLVPGGVGRLAREVP